MTMACTVGSGEVSPRVRLMVIAGCFVTVALASMGMQAMWEVVEWVETTTRRGQGFGRNPFWYQDALGLGVTVALVAIALPRFDVSRLLRVAVLLPVVHLVA